MMWLDQSAEACERAWAFSDRIPPRYAGVVASVLTVLLTAAQSIAVRFTHLPAWRGLLILVLFVILIESIRTRKRTYLSSIAFASFAWLVLFPLGLLLGGAVVWLLAPSPRLAHILQQIALLPLAGSPMAWILSRQLKKSVPFGRSEQPELTSPATAGLTKREQLAQLGIPQDEIWAALEFAPEWRELEIRHAVPQRSLGSIVRNASRESLRRSMVTAQHVGDAMRSLDRIYSSSERQARYISAFVPLFVVGLSTLFCIGMIVR